MSRERKGWVLKIVECTFKLGIKMIDVFKFSSHGLVVKDGWLWINKPRFESEWELMMAKRRELLSQTQSLFKMGNFFRNVHKMCDELLLESVIKIPSTVRTLLYEANVHSDNYLILNESENPTSTSSLFHHPKNKIYILLLPNWTEIFCAGTKKVNMKSRIRTVLRVKPTI